MEDAELDREVGAELEARTPEPQAAWSRALRDALRVEAARRPAGARPERLWLRVGGLVVVGVGLLAAAVALV